MMEPNWNKQDAYEVLLITLLYLTEPCDGRSTNSTAAKSQSPRFWSTITTDPPAKDLLHHRSQLTLVITAVTCVAALLFVCVFTLSLMLVIKQQNTRPSRNRHMSEDYETMSPVPDVGLRCRVDPECTHLSACLPQLQGSIDIHCMDTPTTSPAIYTQIDRKHRRFTIDHRSMAVDNYIDDSDYADVEVPKQVCHYQQLSSDLQEEHIYHNLLTTPFIKIV